MNNPEFFIQDTAWAKELEDNYESYMWDVELHVAPEDDLETHGITLPKTLSGEIFCGCSTCYTREQLYFLVPRIIKVYLDGKISLTEEPNEK